ncbi:MAG: hypothetical protein WCA85_25560 [Paraburkholderia sp.]|uniref:hypothetical protein n=1 Tax=Paraburkholderia sp. TaxID=1926495 RepID=UPI003C393321
MSRSISRPLFRRWSVLAASCLTVLALDVALSGVHAASQDEQAKACRGDAMKFCSAEIPNKDKITACMKQHKKELSPGCQAMFKPEHHSADQSG